ncbi:GIY-YIG nuclease family protein [Vibrio rumoiensis]|uniref:GIY-YIG nuclease family protein n=1 Tax=Vibrio rumoiensis TaxID=76258 RepID=UPI00374A263A
MEYLNNLIEACQRAKCAKPISEHKVKHFDEVPSIEKGIYIIREVGGDKQHTFNTFKQFKEKKLKACCKLNNPSSVMYVGSSTTGLKKRLQQHLVACPDKTYALRLYEWFEGEFEVSILEYNETIEIIQLIEDALSYELTPAFGKQGGNNK